MVIVQYLVGRLPSRYAAEPRVHSGSQVEIDVATFEQDVSGSPALPGGNGMSWQLSDPSVAVETDLLNTDEYEVRVYDAERERRLVAAVEIVSPSNKDRPESRRVFVAKCEALLRKGVSVSIIDLVTSRHFNLYAELLELVGQSDPSLGAEPPATYAAACRWIQRGRKRILETWSHVLALGQPWPRTSPCRWSWKPATRRPAACCASPEFVSQAEAGCLDLAEEVPALLEALVATPPFGHGLRGRQRGPLT